MGIDDQRCSRRIKQQTTDYSRLTVQVSRAQVSLTWRSRSVWSLSQFSCHRRTDRKVSTLSAKLKPQRSAAHTTRHLPNGGKHLQGHTRILPVPALQNKSCGEKKKCWLKLSRFSSVDDLIETTFQHQWWCNVVIFMLLWNSLRLTCRLRLNDKPSHHRHGELGLDQNMSIKK